MTASRPFASLLLVCLVSLVAAAMARAGELETVELIPEDRAGWSAQHLVAPISGLLRGDPGYWYKPRKIEVRTTPPGAALDLFYVRRNFQKGYEQADAPALLVLPSRIEASSRDSVTIRAFMDGYRQAEVNVKVRSGQEKIVIDLEPLANSLVAVTHLYLAGRASLSFLTKEALTFRVQQRDQGYAVVLLQTGNTSEATDGMKGLRSALVASLRAQQLGEDLVVRIGLTDRARDVEVDLRSRQDYDPVRRLHSFSLEVVSPDGGATSVRRARAALARVEPQHVSGCAARFDGALRARLEPSALARALAPKGAFTDAYLRAAMKRLGEVSPGGAVVLTDGTTYRTSIPLELVAAASQAAEAKGYLALLRRFVAELESPAYRRGTLRGLIAPEVSPAGFETLMDEAETAEQRCFASAS
jgi:hypothetical protein